MRPFKIKCFAIVLPIAMLLGCSAPQSSDQESQVSESHSSISQMSDWVKYQNTVFNYSLLHPTACKPVQREASAKDITEVGDIGFCSLILNPEPAESFQKQSPQIAEKMRLPLEQFAKYIWEKNKFDKNPNIKGKYTSDLEEFSVGAMPAFKFNFNSSFEGVRGGMIAFDETTAVIFFDGKINWTVIYPAKDIQAAQILQTMELTHID